MYNKKFIENLSKFTKVNENKLRDYLKNNEIKTLLEHFQIIEPTKNQMDNFNDLKRLNNIYNKLNKYKEYKFENTEATVDFIKSEYENLFKQEKFIVMFLDKENKLLGTEDISVGTLNASIVHPRDVFRKAMEYNANRLILSHNHPSGNSTPSTEDVNLTDRLEDVAKLFDIEILDHIVIGRDDYYSFKENGYIYNKFKLEKTNNKRNKQIYNEDKNEYVSLLNKFTKATKTRLRKIFREVDIIDFNQNPEKHITDKEQIEKLNMLKEIREAYSKEKQNKEILIKSPEDSRNYILSKYKNCDDINIVMYLDTKNQIINSEILPSNLNSKKEAKYIFKKAILHDSNSIMLVTKSNNKILDNKSRVFGIDDYSDKIGIKLLDNIDISNSKTNSYRRSGIITDPSIKKHENIERKSLGKVLDEIDMEHKKYIEQNKDKRKTQVHSRQKERE